MLLSYGSIVKFRFGRRNANNNFDRYHIGAGNNAMIASCDCIICKKLEKGCLKNNIQKYTVLERIFNGLIPKDTKKKIREAVFFNKSDIYIIAEAEEKDWQARVPEPISDPIVIGLFENQAYLIDHFNTTPFEELMIDKFTM